MFVKDFQVLVLERTSEYPYRRKGGGENLELRIRIKEGKIEINNSRESARKEVIGNYNLEKSEFSIFLGSTTLVRFD